jgi:ubiquinone/menaquinone biosynthesis C-methylase UbiE
MAHSEEYLNDTRDLWWNRDFLDLMSKRWDIAKYQSLLDVGSGLCHWSKLFVNYLEKPAKIVAVDNDKKWSKGNYEIKKYFEDNLCNIDFIKCNAQNLCFPDNSFDIVTCQTLLIHVKNYKKVLKEMYRVLKPGGVLICSEPNNLINALTFDKITKKYLINKILNNVKFELIFDRGKNKLNEGDTSIAEIIPEYFYKLGLDNINIYLSDKVITETPATSLFDSNDESDYLENEMKYSLKYFKAFGKKYLSLYDKYWKNKKEYNDQITKFKEEKKYFLCKATLMYLISGVKKNK